MGRRVFLLRVLIVSQTVQYTTQYVLVDIFCLQASIRAFKSTSLSPGSSPSSLSRSVSVIFLLHRFQNYENFNWFCVSFTPMCCCELMIIYSSYSAMTSFYANAHSSRCIFPVSMAYIPPRCRFPVSMAYFRRCMFPASWPSLLAGCRSGLTTKRWKKDALTWSWSHQLLFQKMCQDVQFWAKPHIVQVPARVALGVTTLLAMSTTQVLIFCKKKMLFISLISSHILKW